MEEDELTFRDRLQHKPAVEGGVEEASAFPGGGAFTEGVDILVEDRVEDSLDSEALEVVLVRDVVDLPNSLEDSLRVVLELGNLDRFGLLALSLGEELEVVFELEVFFGELGLAFDKLDLGDAFDGHLNSEHHVDDEVPVLVEEKNHIFFHRLLVLGPIFRSEGRVRLELDVGGKYSAPAVVAGLWLLVILVVPVCMVPGCLAVGANY